MEQYEVAFQPSVKTDLRKLSSENRDRILVRITGLRNEPLPSQVVKLIRLVKQYEETIGYKKGGHLPTLARLMMMTGLIYGASLWSQSAAAQ